MKRTITLSAILAMGFLVFIFDSSDAQVGIGTTTPAGLLDINSSNPAAPGSKDGFLVPRVSAFPVTPPGASQNSEIIYLTATVGNNGPGFYFWDNAHNAWAKLVAASNSGGGTGFSTPLVSAAGGTDLNFGLGDWKDQIISPLIMNVVADPTSLYNTATGVVTVKQAGLYYITSTIDLVNPPSISAFNGVAGDFRTALQIKAAAGTVWNNISATDKMVYESAFVSGTPAFNDVFNNNATLAFLQQGDQLRQAFETIFIINMSTFPNGITISKTNSSLNIYRL